MFQNKNLSVIAYANGFTLWHYSSHDKMDALCCDGFFNTMKSLMNGGDIIIICGLDDTALFKITDAAPAVKIKRI
ncbi:MAG: hypothetical protein LBO08_01325 [Rickettsiales bacterium]|nr:hypothetical protein [Rickettsiales bacterium]